MALICFDKAKCGIINPPPQHLMLLAHAPFCHVMAGRGAPDVSQCRMTDMLSITALSEGPAVMLGAIPGRGGVSHAQKHKHTEEHNQVRQG